MEYDKIIHLNIIVIIFDQDWYRIKLYFLIIDYNSKLFCFGLNMIVVELNVLVVLWNVLSLFTGGLSNIIVWSIENGLDFNLY